MNAINKHHIAIIVDARNVNCPLPLLKAKQALAKVKQGDHIQVLATDAGSVDDIRAFTELTDHRLVDFSDDQGTYTYVIRKGE